MTRPDAPIDSVRARAFRIPTDAPEADGTFAWDHTTIVIAEVSAANVVGLGYSYTSTAAVPIIDRVLTPRILHEDAFAIEKLWTVMVREVRNLGWRGICSTAISALDTALWDLKARLVGLPLARLFGAAHEGVPIYGSGGFTSYDTARLREQLGTWVSRDGCRSVKMKIGTDPAEDPKRMRAAREAVGDAGLMIDANGAFDRKQALSFAERAAELGVTWFEEPVSSDDLEGLRLLRDRAPTPVEIAAGEYGYEPFYFRRMMKAGAVDVIQADATRCCGYTGFLRVAALADAEPLALSAHTAPALHLPVCCAVPRLRHVEWFHNHARIERMLFDGVPVPGDGMIRPDLTRPGHGLALKRADAEAFAT